MKTSTTKKEKTSHSAPVYDESAIESLESLEHIRLRSGMYIGRLGDGTHQDDGIYILLKEIVDNAIDEYIMGYGKKIVITLNTKTQTVSVRDFGRGIPLGKVIDCVSKINTGAKYNSVVFQFSVGLNGVGTKAVNALASHFFVRSVRDGLYKQATFSQGTLREEKEGTTKEKNGTYVEFTPDDEIFSTYEFNIEIIKRRLWNYAYLNKNLSLYLNDEVILSKNGIADLLADEIGEKLLYEIVRYEQPQLEFAFTHVHGDNTAIFSFVNGQHTADGGTHLSAFLEGLLRGVNEFYNAAYTSADLKDGMVAALALRVQNPIFESQTKNKLSNTEIKTPLVQQTRNAIVDLLYKNKKTADVLSEKLQQNQKIRKELNSVRKEAREAAKKVSIKVPNFRDCKIHRNDKKRSDETTIFITEGLSASGSIVPARDVETHAIFSLRGKLANVVDGKRTKIYKDSELYNMMVALGIENSVENLRFQNVVIATDADFDGFHIRNLLITFFLTYFEKLVLDNHLYILETPLFRVRSKNQIIYCYTIQQRDSAVETLGKSTEITRFKGLGEISPKEFEQFLGKNIRLVPVTIKTLKIIPKTLEFYMGKNTEERKKFIAENLV